MSSGEEFWQWVLAEALHGPLSKGAVDVGAEWLRWWVRRDDDELG